LGRTTCLGDELLSIILIFSIFMTLLLHSLQFSKEFWGFHEDTGVSLLRYHLERSYMLTDDEL
jgi:hypothetical protein